ncbi:MAG TPA: redox-regulated ATPase YchF [Candidatus Omnitrophota bacterium]|nr:redox-regulated ATPase YchF [Candidatus Omnitrophota bacterium]
MKIGIIGLPQVGKKTLFALLTGDKVSENYGDQEIKAGAAKIRDTRFDRLVEMYHPRKSVPATIDVVLLPKFDKETVSSGEFLKSLEKCDALCHIVRAFSDASVFHVDGSVNPLRDVENVYTELILADLILAEKRLTRLASDLKKGGGSPGQQKEKEILERMKKLLDENLPLINVSLSPDDNKLMSTYQFLTRKPMIIVLNVDDDKITEQSLVQQIEQKYKDYGVKVMQTSAKIESELSSLNAEEREVFLRDLHIQEPALNRLSALCFDVLGLISFFTVGEDEVRAWTTRKGSLAPEAAGAIHSDLQRGFIRAEIMKTGELFRAGSEIKLKEAGKLMLKGKDYTIEDGDIMHVRFNV